MRPGHAARARGLAALSLNDPLSRRAQLSRTMHATKANHVFVQFEGAGLPGRIRYDSLDDAVEAYWRYDDDADCRRRECIRKCWVFDANAARVILGTPPAGWRPDSPFFENDASY